jgi:NADPH:quinone reductase-like Zn-dependent oxidoreductase
MSCSTFCLLLAAAMWMAVKPSSSRVPGVCPPCVRLHLTVSSFCAFTAARKPERRSPAPPAVLGLGGILFCGAAERERCVAAGAALRCNETAWGTAARLSEGGTRRSNGRRNAVTYERTALDKADNAIGGLKGKRILVLGASGGVGQFAVQLAKAEHGMHVTAVCSAKQSEFVKSLGADETWDYKLGIDNLKATYSAAEKQFDVVFDVIGEELLAAAMSGGILKSGGVVTHIMNRGSKGADKEYTAASEAGTGPKFVTTLVEPSGDQLSRLTQLFNEKKLRLKVAQQMPLEEVGKAQELVIEGHAGGKVVLTI